jgi:hypothetical protein
MHEIPADGEKYLDDRETSSVIRAKTQTLANWRHLKKGPPYIKAGGKVLYRLSDLKAWLESNLVFPAE